jgi:hypothetical protein
LCVISYDNYQRSKIARIALFHVDGSGVIERVVRALSDAITDARQKLRSRQMREIRLGKKIKRVKSNPSATQLIDAKSIHICIVNFDFIMHVKKSINLIAFSTH